MTFDDDSWHSVSEEENELFNIPVPKKKIDIRNVKINLFTSILKVLKDLQYQNVQKDENQSDFLYFVKMRNKNLSKLEIFNTLISLGIKSKLFVNFDEGKIEFFIHVYLQEIAQQEKINTSGLILTIDSHGIIINETIIHSTKYKHYQIFDTIINEIKSVVPRMDVFSKTAHFFLKKPHESILLNYLFRHIPNSINKLKKHPLYVLPSILAKNEYIHPMRPVLGYFKGEPVYLRSNVKKYHSELTWFRKGREIKEESKKKFIKLKDKKLYRIYETKEIEIPKITDKTMKYFHKNHIPLDCCYINHENAQEIAILLKIEHAACIVGFRYKDVVKKGIFCNKKYEKLVLDALNEYGFNRKCSDFIENGRNFFKTWDKILKKTNRFLELKDAFD